MQPTPVFLPGDSHGQRSLGGYSPWGCQELDMTACMHSYHLIQHFQFYLFKANDNIGLLKDLYSNVHMGLSLHS